MPNLDDIMEKRAKKKFVKKEYRPWDLKGEGRGPDTSNTKSEVESNESPKKTSAIKDKQDPIVSKALSKQSKPTIETKQLTKNTVEKKPEQLTTNEDQIKIYLTLLAGIQKKIMEFVVYTCAVKNSSETGSVRTIEIANYAKVSTDSIKTSIARLIKKGLLQRLPGKAARGGYVNLYIPENIKKMMGNLEMNTGSTSSPVEFMRDFNSHQSDKEGGFSGLSTSNVKHSLPEEWANINIDPLGDIGFSINQLKQLYSLNILSPEVVQDSIYHLAYGLKYNPKTQAYQKEGKDLVNVLMGVLRKGNPWVETSYKSPQEIAQTEFITRKKEERERFKELEKQAYSLALEDWQASLKQDEIEKIAPAKKKRGDLTPQNVKLSMHFKDKIWPKVKSSYIA